MVDDPDKPVDTLAAHHVTRIVLVPSLLRIILETGLNLHRRLPELELWISSGETLPMEICRRFSELMPQSVLLNLYGSSEVSADVTCYDTSVITAGHATVPIGRPHPRKTIHGTLV